mmetsp:Transcript_93683/g.269800  ORF Transcript_93683/g.269800 Transcript_93683/m.269800 type:complete len:206 (+) Transcript_93683:1060-1677(+)
MGEERQEEHDDGRQQQRVRAESRAALEGVGEQDLNRGLLLLQEDDADVRILAVQAKERPQLAHVELPISRGGGRGGRRVSVEQLPAAHPSRQPEAQQQRRQRHQDDLEHMVDMPPLRRATAVEVPASQHHMLGKNREDRSDAPGREGQQGNGKQLPKLKGRVMVRELDEARQGQTCESDVRRFGQRGRNHAADEGPPRQRLAPER